MSLLRLSGGKGLNFAASISCKAFEKRKPPVEVIATKVQKVKVNFNGDTPEGVIYATLNKSGGGVKKVSKKPKAKPRKSPALRKRASPSRSKTATPKLASPSRKIPTSKAKTASPTRKTSPKKKKRSPTRAVKK